VPWFLNSLVSSVAHRSGKEISALDNTFALIDVYIGADHTVTFTFCLQQGRGPYIGMFHLNDHLAGQQKILSHHSIVEMQKPIVPTDDGESYGLGWWVQNDLNGYHAVLAQGGTKDATAYLQLIPAEDISVAMLWIVERPIVAGSSMRF